MTKKSLGSKTIAGLAVMLCAVSCGDDAASATSFGDPIAGGPGDTDATGTATSSATDTPPGFTTITASAGGTGTSTNDAETDSSGPDTDPSGPDTSTGPSESESSSESTTGTSCGDDARGVRRAEGIENITSQGAVPRERQHIDVHGRIDRNRVVDGSASLSETRPERVVVSLKPKTVDLVEGDRCVVDEVARIVVADGQQRLPLVLGAGQNLAFVHVSDPRAV